MQATRVLIMNACFWMSKFKIWGVKTGHHLTKMTLLRMKVADKHNNISFFSSFSFFFEYKATCHIHIYLCTRTLVMLIFYYLAIRNTESTPQMLAHQDNIPFRRSASRCACIYVNPSRPILANRHHRHDHLFHNPRFTMIQQFQVAILWEAQIRRRVLLRGLNTHPPTLAANISFSDEPDISTLHVAWFSSEP